jgi:hypothetical protein
MNTKEFIKTQAERLSLACANLAKNDVSIREFQIDSSDLDEKYLNQDIRDAEKFKEMFAYLSKIDNKPCLYYFEIQSDINSQTVFNQFKEFAKTSEKVMPATYKNYPKDSKVLYVGKVNSHIVGRLTTHLGFLTREKNGERVPLNSHGLQLYRWAKDLKIKFTVLQFDDDMRDLMEVMEKSLAKELKPIIGKH